VGSAGCALVATLDEHGPTGGSDAGGSVDARVETDGGPPALVDAGPCDLDGAFGDLKLVEGINTDKDEGSARLMPDELSVYFSSSGAFSGAGDPAGDIFFATRERVTDPFSNVLPVTKVNSANPEAHPTVTADGLLLIYNVEAFLDGGKTWDLWVTSRKTSDAGFDDPGRIPGAFNSPFSDSYPYLRPDGKEFFFASNRNGRQHEIFASYPGPGGLGTPEPIREVNSPRDDTNPVITDDGLTLFLASGTNGATSTSVYVTHRKDVDGDFAPPQPVAELAHPDGGVARPTWVSPDGCRIYLVADYPTSRGKDVWMAHRPVLR
jgi:hypothetical protein